MSSRLQRVMVRAAAVVLATGLALVVAEAAVRLLAPVPEMFPHWQWDTLPKDWEGSYTADSELGYRPVLGAGEYSQFGTVVNDYPVAKRDGVIRHLSLGDSVTHRWAMQRLFVKRCRSSAVEFWNAGVEGFNTGQEVEYYLRWNHRIGPDHVTLVFHNNDFVATPVAFLDREGKAVVANPHAYLSRADVVWARHTHLYRHFLKARISRMLEDDPVTTGKETRAALARLKRELEATGIGFTVILFPVLKPRELWTEYEKRSRSLSLEIFEELGIPFYDLLRPLKAAVRDGIELHEDPGDAWHPSNLLARRFARHLFRRGYLEAIVDPGDCAPQGGAGAAETDTQ